MDAHTARAQFAQRILPYLPAAYNLARWLIRRECDAEDVVQEAVLRAFKFFGTFRGGDSQAWLLTIVRRTCYTWLRQHQAYDLNTEVFDEELHHSNHTMMNPETLLLPHTHQQFLIERSIDCTALKNRLFPGGKKAVRS